MEHPVILSKSFEYSQLKYKIEVFKEFSIKWLVLQKMNLRNTLDYYNFFMFIPKYNTTWQTFEIWILTILTEISFSQIESFNNPALLTSMSRFLEYLIVPKNASENLQHRIFFQYDLFTEFTFKLLKILNICFEKYGFLGSKFFLNLL